MLDDPNYFFNNIEYEIIFYSKGWLITELSTDKHYPYKMIINDQGQIYKTQGEK